jgi:hypothetical protein
MSAHPLDEAIAFENAFETASEYVDRKMTTEGTMSMAAAFYYEAFYTEWAKELDSAAFYYYPAEPSAEELGYDVFCASMRWWYEPDEGEMQWLWDGMEPRERAKWVDAADCLMGCTHRP